MDDPSSTTLRLLTVFLFLFFLLACLWVASNGHLVAVAWRRFLLVVAAANPDPFLSWTFQPAGEGIHCFGINFSVIAISVYWWIRPSCSEPVTCYVRTNPFLWHPYIKWKVSTHRVLTKISYVMKIIRWLHSDLGFGNHKLQQTNDLGANHLALSAASCDLSDVERHLLYTKGKGNAGIIISYLVVRFELL